MYGFCGIWNKMFTHARVSLFCVCFWDQPLFHFNNILSDISQLPSCFEVGKGRKCVKSRYHNSTKMRFKRKIGMIKITWKIAHTFQYKTKLRVWIRKTSMTFDPNF